MADKISDPMGMRFLLPEHVTALVENDYLKTLVRQPVLEEDELMEMSYQIIKSIQFDYAISIKWWIPIRGELGRFKTFWGTAKIIPDLNQVKLTRDEDVAFIPISQIVSISEKYSDHHTE